MGGRGRTGPSAPPRSFRGFTLGLALATIPLLPEALREAAAQPVQLAAWTLLLSVATFADVIILPRRQVIANLRSPLSISTAVLLVPSLALLVNLLAMISPRELRGQVPPWMALFNHLQSGMAAFLASLAAHALPLSLVPRTVTAVVVFQIANVLAVAVAAVLLRRLGVRDVKRAVRPYPLYATNAVLIGMLALLTVVLYAEAGPWAVTLGVIPLWVGYEALRATKQASDRAMRVRQLEVVNRLGTDLLSALEAGSIAALASDALRAICGQGHDPADIVVALDGRLPDHLKALAVPGSVARIGLPRGLDPASRAGAETVCGTLGLALQRLALERELTKSQRAQAELAERILVEGETSRDRVALHVHDGVLPVMAAAQIQADNAVHAAESGDLAVATRLSRKVRDAVEHSIATLRAVLDDLRQQTLPPGQLLPALRRMADETQMEHGISVDLDIAAPIPAMSHTGEILLADATMSLLRNVVQHARAERVWIGLSCDDDFAAMAISDDGIGFDPVLVPPGGGLTRLRQRVGLINGRVTIDTAPGRGTTVRVHVQLTSTPATDGLRDVG